MPGKITLTTSQIAYIKENRLIMTSYEIRAVLDVSKSFYSHWLKKNNLSVCKSVVQQLAGKKRTRYFTEAEDQQIKKLLPTTSCREISKLFKCTKSKVSARARELGLGKLLDKKVKASTFQKGSSPFNKGKKLKDIYTPEQIKKVASTWWKKGHVPQNTKTDFSISKRKDKKGNCYFCIRLSMGNWVYLHRYIWELHHGKIKKGFNIQFCDGDSLNCQIENLYMVDREYQLQHNKEGGSLLTPELKESITLITKIKKILTEL